MEAPEMFIYSKYQKINALTSISNCNECLLRIFINYKISSKSFNF
jgi:hypothetical protein